MFALLFHSFLSILFPIIVRAAQQPLSTTTTVTLYYESLCPFSQEFFNHQLVKVHRSNLENHVTIDLVPYGNVRVTRKEESSNKNGSTVELKEFHCQHGTEECFGNRIQGCVIEHYRNNNNQNNTTNGTKTSTLSSKSTSFAFVECMFSDEHNLRDARGNAQRCAQKLNLDWSLFNKCADGPEGLRIFEENGHKTDALQPPHTSVPWITIDGVHNDAIQHEARTDLLTYLCQHYLNHGRTFDGCSH